MGPLGTASIARPRGCLHCAGPHWAEPQALSRPAGRDVPSVHAQKKTPACMGSAWGQGRGITGGQVDLCPSEVPLPDNGVAVRAKGMAFLSIFHQSQGIQRLRALREVCSKAPGHSSPHLPVTASAPGHLPSPSHHNPSPTASPMGLTGGLGRLRERVRLALPPRASPALRSGPHPAKAPARSILSTMGSNPPVTYGGLTGCIAEWAPSPPVTPSV